MGNRRADRVRASAVTQVGFVATDHKFTAPLHDFSPFGLSVTTSQEVKHGTIFRLGIQIGDQYFHAAAIARAQFPGGFAVEFLSMSPLDREMVRRLYLRLKMAARDASPA